MGARMGDASGFDSLLSTVRWAAGSGELFLLNRAVESRGVEPITLVQNWPATLKK